MLPICTILHPTDFSERSLDAFHLAGALARDYEAKLIVLYVSRQPIIAYGEGVIPPDPDLLVEEAMERLNQLVAEQPSISAECRYTEGDPAAEILRLARERQVDLVVMGTHGRTGLSRLLMGSVAEQVVRRAPCPVLTVKSPVPETMSVGEAHMVLGTV